MYCEVSDVVMLLPDSISVGDNNIGTPSPGRPTQKRDSLTPDEMIHYIRLGAQEIDSRLRPYYVCPLRRIKQYETDILNNVSPGTNVHVRVNDTGLFAQGQLVRMQNYSNMETDTIESIQDMTTLVISSVKYSYNLDEGLISILAFPDPIPLINARLAVSYAFDELFNAQQAPDISTYGQEQRKLAINSIDSILTGTVLLLGQEHVNKRFVRGSLFDAYQNPTPDLQFGREKS